LLEYLETVSITPASVTDGGFHLPVQWVNRPNLDFRGYAGAIASGVARVGQAVAVLPAGSQSQISRIVTAGGDLTSAVAGQSVTVTLADEIDVSRGDVIVPVTHILPASTRVSARLLWMDEGRLTKGASLIVKLAAATANARMAELIHAVDIHSFTPRPATSLGMNEIGLVDLAFDKPLVVTDYQTNQELGAFILIDRMTNQTVALGMIEPGQGDGEASSWVRRIGGTFGTGSAGFWQSATSHLLGAGLLAALVFAVSDNPIAAAAVAAGEVLLAPALRQLVKAVWPVGAASSS
jgi:bifunctional enzyme CysN/CysC